MSIQPVGFIPYFLSILLSLPLASLPCSLSLLALLLIRLPYPSWPARPLSALTRCLDPHQLPLTRHFSKKLASSLKAHRYLNSVYKSSQSYISFLRFAWSFSHVWLFATPWTAAHQVYLSITNSQSLLKSIKSVMPPNLFMLCHPLLLLPSFPASVSFPVSQFFVSGGQSIGASASASVLPLNIQDWFPLGLTGLISSQSRRLSRVFSNTTKASKATPSLLNISVYFP